MRRYTTRTNILINFILYDKNGSLCRTALPINSTQQQTVSIATLHNNALHRKRRGEKDDCLHQSVFVFFGIRGSIFHKVVGTTLNNQAIN